jgi:hypothetical protein
MRLTEPSKGDAAKLSRALLAERRLTTENVQLKQTLETERAKAKSLQSKIDAAKNPLKALELAGINPRDFIRGIAEGKFVEQPGLPPEVQERLNRLEQEAEQSRTESERRAATQREQEVRTSEVQYVSDYLKERAEKFPLLAAAGWAPERLREQFHELTRANGGVEPVLDELVAEGEQQILTNIRATLSPAGALAKVFSDPQFRKAVVEHLSATETKPKPSPTSTQTPGKKPPQDGPRAVPQSVTAEIPARPDAPPMTAEQKRSQAIDAIRSAKRKASGG